MQILHKSIYKPVLHDSEKDENTKSDKTDDCMHVSSKSKKTQQKMSKKGLHKDPDKGLVTNRYSLRNSFYFINLNMRSLINLL